jgi:cyanophycinase
MKRLTAIALGLVATSTAFAQAPKVGPAQGSVMVVGGGAIDKAVFQKFIELAGGPDALIIDVPTAGGNATYGAKTATSRQIEAAGAKNVLVLHTVDRKVADADSFTAPIAKAGGIWFEGGRQWHLVDSYAGTKSETAFREVLDRGGVIGGTSAGASILASFLLRGAREGNTVVVAPEYLAGFGYLRETAIDQHVVARSRLRDLADSLVPRYPKLLGISEDEGTVWLVQGDSAVIMGRNKAFAYNGNGNDPGRPFVTLHPGDKYDLANRRVISRAIDRTRLTEAFVDETVRRAIGGAQAAIVVAQDRKVLVNKSWNVPEDSTGQGANRHATYMPTTTLPQLALGGLSKALLAVVSQNAALEGKAGLADSIMNGHVDNRTLTTRLYNPIGMHQTRYDAKTGEFRSDVDELYRLELGLEDSGMFLSDSAEARGATALDPSVGWVADAWHGTKRFSQYATPDGKRAAFMRIPERGVTVILLTDSPSVDAKGVAERIAEKLLK